MSLLTKIASTFSAELFVSFQPVIHNWYVTMTVVHTTLPIIWDGAVSRVCVCVCVCMCVCVCYSLHGKEYG